MSKSHVRRMRGTKSLVLFCPLAIALAASAQSTSITAAGFSQYWGTSNASYDLDGNGIVNGVDLSIFLTGSGSDGGSGVAVPPPTGGTETPGASTPAAAGPSAPKFELNGVGVTGPYLMGGSGFAGPSSAPAQIGDPALLGGTANAIARWDFIPYRTVTEPVNIGVVAFHTAGIEKVSFSANGGPWVNMSEMRRNPQTGVSEYFVTIRPENFPDGRVEIRAIAYPTRGHPRILQGPREGREKIGEYSMVLWNNHGGTLPSQQRWVSVSGSDNNDGRTALTAMRTIPKAAASIHSAQSGNAGGGFVNVMPGTYAWAGAGTDQLGASVTAPATTERWLTVRRAVGSTADVTFTSSTSDGPIRTNLLALEGLKFLGSVPSRPGTNVGSLIWIANCDLRGVGTANDSTWLDGGYSGGLMTQTSISNCITGCSNVMFLRDVHSSEIGKDAFTQARLMLNCTTRGILRPDGATWHCDVVQFSQPPGAQVHENVIIFGFKAFDCRSQGFLARSSPQNGDPTWKDFAIVNYFCEFSQGSEHTCQWRVSADHVLFWNCSLIGGTSMIRPTNDLIALRYKNISVKSCVFTKLTAAPACISAWDCAFNHSITGSAWGVGATVGDPKFIAPLNNDYRPSPGSPLLNRILVPMLPVDSNLLLVTAPGNIGSFED